MRMPLFRSARQSRRFGIGLRGSIPERKTRFPETDDDRLHAPRFYPETSKSAETKRTCMSRAIWVAATWCSGDEPTGSV